MTKLHKLAIVLMLSACAVTVSGMVHYGVLATQQDVRFFDVAEMSK